jgi:hypothetical protein
LGRLYLFPTFRDGTAVVAEVPAYRDCHVVVERTGMCLLLVESEFREHFQNDTRFYFQLAC